MTAVRTVWTATAALALVGAALRVTRPPLSRAAADSLPIPPPAPPARPADRPVPATELRRIVTANVFSSARTPPRTRFVPTGLARAARAAAVPARPLLRLYGITVGDRGAIALIDADSKIPGAEIYRVGDQVAGAPIVAITDSTVTIAQSSGPLVLRLQPGDRRRP